MRVDDPDPGFAKALQQASGGIEGEIRVAMQYMFQAVGARGPVKYRDLLMGAATEALDYIEMLACAVPQNHEGADMHANVTAEAALPNPNATISWKQTKKRSSPGSKTPTRWRTRPSKF